MAPSKKLVAVDSKAVSPIKSDQTLKASTALISHIKKASKQKVQESSKRNALEDSDREDDAAETPIWLTLTTKRHVIDKPRLQPGKISLPHPLNSDESSEICLIVADPQRAYKNIVDHEDFPEALRKRVTRVIDFGKLKAKFKQYDAQRKLFSEHDIFLADDRIINRLPKVLGKTFYKNTQKRPIPVVLQAKAPKVDGKRKRPVKKEGDVNAATPEQIAKEIQKAAGSALVNLSPSTSTAVRIGYAGWTPEQIADNVDAVVTALVDRFVPQKWSNVRGVHIKGPESAALPIWLTDELWIDDKDVMANDSAPALKAAEKANVGKKRKAAMAGAEEQADEEDGEEEEAEPAPKKKKSSKKQNVPEGDDDKLDKQISERKAKLKKQKAAARKAMDD